MKPTNLITEDTERIFNKDISPIKIKSLIDKGYKPYRTNNGKLVPVKYNNGHIKFDYNRGLNDNTVFFLSDKEIEYSKRVEENINGIIELKEKQVRLLKQYLPAFINEIINNRKPQGLPKL